MTTTTPTTIECATLASGKRAAFESYPCTRCGGTGHMPFSIDGGRCFKCGRSGVNLTKRGRAAAAFYRDLLTKRVGDLEPGDKILDEGIPGITGSGWREVIGVTDNREDRRGGHILNAERDAAKLAEARERGAAIEPRDNGEVVVYEGLNVHCEDFGMTGYSADSKVRVARSGEFKREAMQQAKAYELTLTKTGQPRKR